MPRVDMALDDLLAYRCRTPEPEGLDAFWDETLAAHDHPLDVVLTPLDNQLTLVDTFDVTFAGYGGASIKAWLHLPANRPGPLPTVVQFQGYSSDRGLPHEVGYWAMAGYAHLTVDTRGQGWHRGAVDPTPDPEPLVPHHPGMMTVGVQSPQTYVYRRIYTDAVRALQVAAGLEQSAGRLVVPAEARAAASPSLRPGWRPRWGLSWSGRCPTYRSCATSAVPWRWPPPGRTPRSRATSRPGVGRVPRCCKR